MTGGTRDSISRLMFAMARLVQGGVVLAAGVLLIVFRSQISDVNVRLSRTLLERQPVESMAKVHRGALLFIGAVWSLLGLAILLGFVSPN